MSPARLILRFLAAFVLAIALLLAPWPGLKAGYARAFRWAGERVFGRFGSKGIVVFRASAGTGDSFRDTTIYLGNRDMVRPGGQLDTATVQFSTRYTGYQPTALVLALALTSPIPWRRRWRTLGWGFLWVNLYVTVVTLIMIVHQYNVSPAVGLFQFSGLIRSLLGAAHEILVGYLGAFYAVPVLIWIAVTFRRGDWAGIFGDAVEAAPVSRPEPPPAKPSKN